MPSTYYFFARRGPPDVPGVRAGVSQMCVTIDDVKCPCCSSEMLDGWLAMWNPIIGQKVRWQEPKPGYVRMKVPDGAAVVLQSRVGGKDARPAYRCGGCSATVLPPDPTYDG